MASKQAEPIAIVGSACRFPGGASSPSALWKLLESPRDVLVDIEDDRFKSTSFYHPDGGHHGTSNVRYSYLMQEDVRDFDAAFFNISPNEADSMDPQQRLLLETIYEALEAGGHPIEALRGSDTAVYAGTMTADYEDTLTRDLNTVPNYYATGTSRAIISNRVSYFFDWHGPSMTTDTACSSSLVAVDQGVLALRNGLSRVALACGSQVQLGPEMYIGESKLNMLSPTGRSRMWDADADGYARGEGMAAVVMKKLSDAIADGDHIECLIRETGVNQDGFSNGLTVPNSDAQAMLIRQTYARAGLDPKNNPRDRPQFFEAHGTGTQAGDPKEAGAIYDSFGQYADPSDTPLYVGSIKTIIGHLEGSAGLAGVLKGSAMIQNSLITPNLHFNNLNPRVEPFYKNIQIPTKVTPWPELEDGVPRRVSVNSFGFGGTNAHAILESYNAPPAPPSSGPQGLSFSPFLFSASSEASLVAQLQAISAHLKSNHDSINLSDLAWTLHSRRSQLPYKTSFSALSIDQLTTKIDAKLAEVNQNAGSAIGIRSNIKATPRLLGVFTGQGAQWPAMGAHLIRSSDFARERIEFLEQSLATLPPADRPAWSLQGEILAGKETSRLSEAALAQPLSTAIQILLVDLLKEAGITFSTVVGHSSGEVAAAYAAGFIPAHDAIRVAYYRGLFAKLAGNKSTGQQGTMMAVGTSWDDAQEYVNAEPFKGRVIVAAHNSPASVTLSGDVDAIQEVKQVFDKDKKFARVLKLDKAYHSHHMLAPGEAYLEAIRACGVKVNRERTENSCNWFSSVTASDKPMEAIDDLQDVYWRDNMINPVLFAEAIKNAAASDEHINLAIEVGPHPALKGPATQTVSEVRTAALPYTGVLARDKNDVESFSDALGFVWTTIPRLVNFESFDKAMTSDNSRKPSLVLDLPKYQWNHGRPHWMESRISRSMRTLKQPHHELLGVPSTDSNAHEMRWLNVLKKSEIPWLTGHVLQGQSVFPGAGYVAMALEASKELAGDKSVELFELHNLAISRAITFEEGDNSGTETLITLTGAQYHADQSATADFACYSAVVLTSGSEQEFEIVAKGNVKVVFGTPDVAALASTMLDDYDMSTVDSELFYSTISELGYNYAGPFKTMSSMKRTLNQASVQVDSYSYTDADTSEYLVHPSMLDVAFQAATLAYSAPKDGRLWSISVPTFIGSVRVNPEICGSLPTSGSKVPVCAVLDGDFPASIDLFSEDGEYGMVQIEDLVLRPFAPATKADDRVMFTNTKFSFALPDGAAISNGISPSANEIELATVCERISYHYLRKWKSELNDEDWTSGETHWGHLFDWVKRTLSTASRGQVPTLKKEWSKDSPEEIQALISKYSESSDVKLLTAVGENLPAAVREKAAIPEQAVPSAMLDDWYTTGLGFARYNSFLASMMKQVTHRYPHARILEIGAGSGVATTSVFEGIGDSFSSYTYTDLSADSFTKAKELFKSHITKMKFKALDIEKAPADQEFAPHSYDIVIASNVLHSTASLHTALENTRQLLRPGGYLILSEITNLGPIRYNSILGSLPGWWLGVKDGRKASPLLTLGGWHSALRKAGFGGVDASTPEIKGLAWPMSIMASQAVDEKVQFLRKPLSSPTSSPSAHIESLVILGNGTLETARIGEEVAELLGRFCGEIIILDGLPTDEDAMSLNPMSTFINLVDIESPIFKDVTDEKMDGLKRMLEVAKSILWVTEGAQLDQAYHMASISFGRAIRQEAAHIIWNHLDLSDLEHNESRTIAEYLLRQCALDEWNAPASTLADKEHSDFEFLWSREPEAFLDQGKLKIPRLIENVEQNARINSSRRVITKTVPISGSNIAIVSSSADSPPSLVEHVGRKRKDQTEELVKIESSSLMALHVVGDAFLFLGIGEGKDGKLQVSLSTTNSCETTPVASVAASQHADVGANSLLVAIASELLAETLIQQISTESHILVHCTAQDRFLAKALSRRAGAKAIRITFICSSQGEQLDPKWIQLNARTPAHVVRRMLQQTKPTHYLNLAATTSSSDLSGRITQALALDCVQIDQSTLFRSHSSSLPLLCDQEALTGRLQDAVSKAELPPSQAQDLTIPLESLSKLSGSSATSAVYWPSNGLVEVEVRPLDAKFLFSKDKTYLLVGLTGQMGRSLCEWMVSNGAGCVCLTSRKPNVDERWLESFQKTGSTVKIFAMDVLDQNSIESVVNDIKASCPPIAGVANGAGVFEDQLFANMSTETMQRGLEPKIDGSKNLDEIFYDEDLDFFLLFSSLTIVFGNAGQSNYTAANGYLNGLARQRRRRGLAASAIDIGRVTGIGHITSANQAVAAQLDKKLGLPPVSEIDLRQAMAETILAGFVDPDDEEAIPVAVVTTGLRFYGDDEEVQGPFFSNAYFSHMVKESDNAASSGDDKKASLPVAQQLAEAANREEGLEIMKEPLAAKLRMILLLGDQPIDHEAPLTELGLDSLAAVEVRSWFTKELKVDIPVLKVVGGASLVELCEKALEQLPDETFAGTGKSEKKDAEPPKPAASQTKPKPQAQDKATDSESSSMSGDTSSATPATSTSPTSARSDADPSDLEHTKPAPAQVATAKRPGRRFLKSEPISLPQSRFWFLRHLLEDPTTPNVTISYQVTGNLRVGDMERAIRMVTNRHEALRTCFVEDETEAGEAFQKVLPSSPCRLERKKINSEDDVDGEYLKLKQHVFDLESGDILKLVLLTLSSSKHYFLINYHHIVMDGASFNVWITDLEKAYNGQSLGPLPRPYPDFSTAQRQALEQGGMSEEMGYWQKVFPAGEQPPVLPLLPMSRISSRVAMKGFESHQVGRRIDGDLISRIKSVSKAQRSTAFHFHLAAYKAMLFCLAGPDTKDLTIGIADAARNDDDVKASIGFFLNLLTLRFRRQTDQTFADAIVEAREVSYEALGTSRLPFDILLTELNIARSSLHSPFFQAFLDYRQGVQDAYPWGNCEFEFRDVHPGRTAYDVTLDVTEYSATDTLITFRVQKGLYDESAANLILDTYINFITAITDDASLPAEKIPLFGEKQYAESTKVGRGPDLKSDWPPTLPHRIDQVAQENKDKVALMDGHNNTFTYSDMINKIEAISEALQKAGVVAGSRVLVYEQPAVYWPCSMLAIMRLGAVYVPLDLRNPVTRLAAVAKDCEPTAILVDATTVDEAPQLEAPNARIIDVTKLPAKASSHITNIAEKDKPAAILYTSGSTGTPKGIVVTHAGLRNEIEGYTKMWGLKAERVLQQSSYTFNHSSDQMYTGLVNGGMVYTVPAEQRGDPVSITKIVQEQKISYTKATPSEYSLWMQFGGDTLKQATSWRFAFGGGESLTSLVTNEFADLGLSELRFFNSYGPTEISISSHKMEIPYREKETVEAMARIPCGYSLPNYHTYIVDEQLQSVPVGMPGEICLGGAGVSQGYLHNEELTNQCFIHNPFATPEDVAQGWTRMYRTGDIAHLQEDGAMVFHSRIAGNAQVKIRGLRIELNDIESNIVLAAGGALREAVVTLREGDSPFLVAHVVFNPLNQVKDKDSYLANLLTQLPIPQYMIPVVAIPLDKFPLSNHSKVDRRAVEAMPLPERVGTVQEEDTEMTETMLQLKQVWQDVLGKNTKKLGFDLTPSTNFFMVGGNSLLIIRLQAKIRQAFNFAVPLAKLLAVSTLGEMARKIEESASVELLDWEKETVPPAPASFLKNIPTKSGAKGKTVLLTGSTGFLGKRVLPELDSRSDIETIHCVAVRDKPRDGEPFSSPKVVHHVGDLTMPLLGLSEDKFRELASQVDVILHLGGSRSFWDNYNVLRRLNVHPVKELVKLAAPRHLPILFISTMGVLPKEAMGNAAVSAAANPPPTDGTSGYVSSKWAGERILERSAEKLGVPSAVYRFLPLSGEQPAQPKQELLDAFVGLVDASGLKPDMAVWKGRIDMMHAKEASEWMADCITSATDAADSTTKFTHMTSPLSVHTDEMEKYIQEQRGDRENLEYMPLLQWFGRLKALGFNYLLTGQEMLVGASEGGQGMESWR